MNLRESELLLLEIERQEFYQERESINEEICTLENRFLELGAVADQFSNSQSKKLNRTALGIISSKTSSTRIVAILGIMFLIYMVIKGFAANVPLILVCTTLIFVHIFHFMSEKICIFDSTIKEMRNVRSKIYVRKERVSEIELNISDINLILDSLQINTQNLQEKVKTNTGDTL